MLRSQTAGSATAKLAAFFGGGALCAAVLWGTMGTGPFAKAVADFEVTCLVLDETGQVEQFEFEASELAILALLIDVSDDVYEKQMDVKLSASAKIDGFKYRVGLPQVIVDIPKRSERETIEGYMPDLQRYTPFRQIAFNDVDVIAKQPVRIPDSVPNTTITLKAVGTIKGHGSQSCEKEVRLVN